MAEPSEALITLKKGTHTITFPATNTSGQRVGSYRRTVRPGQTVDAALIAAVDRHLFEPASPASSSPARTKKTGSASTRAEKT